MPGLTDLYFPPEDSAFEVEHLVKGKLEVIPSVWGHFAGHEINPVDVKWIDQRIGDFFKRTT